MRSVIIGHWPKLAVLPKLVFNAQRPVANSIATANQRIIASCNPTSLPKNDIYERVGTGNNNKENDAPPNSATQTRRPHISFARLRVSSKLLLPPTCISASFACISFVIQHPLLVNTIPLCQSAWQPQARQPWAYSTYKIFGCQGCQDKLLTKLFTQTNTNT